MTRPTVRAFGAVVAMPAAVVGMLAIMPRVSGVGWSVTGDRVEDVPLHLIWLLVAVWALGLWLHTLVLRASLPGLGTRRALALNLGGSSISNVLPWGGAAGIGLNYAMLRSWGYSLREISAFATVSNVVVVVVKACVAVAGLVAVLGSTRTHVSMPVPRLWGVGAALAVAGAVTVVTVLLCSSAARLRVVEALAAARQTRVLILHAVRRGWHLITVGGLGYPALQALLFWLCLHAVGTDVSVVAALTAYAVERLLTLVPFTPGGVGVVEAGATAVLVGLGADPAGAAAGVILFRVFTFFIEIPVGGFIAMLWFARRRTAAARGSRHQIG